jgi:hypothetical protein
MRYAIISGGVVAVSLAALLWGCAPPPIPGDADGLGVTALGARVWISGPSSEAPVAFGVISERTQ